MLIDLIDQCLALATGLREKNKTLVVANADLAAKLLAANKALADAEAKAQALKDDLTAFSASAN